MGPSPRYAALAAACRETPPQAVVILGSGMATAALRVRPAHAVPFAECPGLPAASVSGHRGGHAGDWAGRGLLLFEGRLHRYEGRSWDDVVRPIRLAAELGAPVAVLTNAAGGIRADLAPGALMAMHNHVEWTRPVRGAGPAPAGSGGRDRRVLGQLLGLLERAATDGGMAAQAGGLRRADRGVFRDPGRDPGAEGVGRRCGRHVHRPRSPGGGRRRHGVRAVSLITNRAAGSTAAPPSHAEVLAVASAAAGWLADLLERFLALLGEDRL